MPELLQSLLAGKHELRLASRESILERRLGACWQAQLERGPLACRLTGLRSHYRWVRGVLRRVDVRRVQQTRSRLLDDAASWKLHRNPAETLPVRSSLCTGTWLQPVGDGRSRARGSGIFDGLAADITLRHRVASSVRTTHSLTFIRLHCDSHRSLSKHTWV